MSLVIPVGMALVTQPYFNNDSGEDNAITYGVDIDLTTETAPDIVNSLFNEFVSRFQSQTDDGFQIRPTRMQVGNDGPPLVYVASGVTVNGTRAGTAAPPNCCTIVTKRTTFGGRAYRGRMFFPGLLIQTDIDQGGRIGTSRRSALQTVMANWRTALAAGTFDGGAVGAQPMVLLHTPPGSGGPTPAPTPISSLEIQAVVGTQRGRLPSS